jgi:hypothetical protein
VRHRVNFERKPTLPRPVTTAPAILPHQAHKVELTSFPAYTRKISSMQRPSSHHRQLSPTNWLNHMHILSPKGLVFACLIFVPSNHVSTAQNTLSLRHTIYQAYRTKFVALKVQSWIRNLAFSPKAIEYSLAIQQRLSFNPAKYQ